MHTIICNETWMLYSVRRSKLSTEIVSCFRILYQTEFGTQHMHALDETTRRRNFRPHFFNSIQTTVTVATLYNMSNNYVLNVGFALNYQHLYLASSHPSELCIKQTTTKDYCCREYVSGGIGWNHLPEFPKPDWTSSVYWLITSLIIDYALSYLCTIVCL